MCQGSGCPITTCRSADSHVISCPSRSADSHVISYPRVYLPLSVCYYDIILVQVYLLASLFPGSKDHPVLHNVQLPLQRQISSQRAIKDFHDLCMDKKVSRHLMNYS